MRVLTRTHPATLSTSGSSRITWRRAKSRSPAGFFTRPAAASSTSAFATSASPSSAVWPSMIRALQSDTRPSHAAMRAPAATTPRTSWSLTAASAAPPSPVTAASRPASAGPGASTSAGPPSANQPVLPVPEDENGEEPRSSPSSSDPGCRLRSINPPF